jgi:hypothetical protein
MVKNIDDKMFWWFVFIISILGMGAFIAFWGAIMFVAYHFLAKVW